MESREEEPLQAQSQAQSHSSVQSNVRTNTDIAWEHVTQVVDEKGKKAWICNFCQKVIGGGGINRVKKHLVGIKGEVVACPKVSPEVRFTMQGKLKETAQKEKEKRTTSVTILDDDEEMEEAEISTMKKGKMKYFFKLASIFYERCKKISFLKSVDAYDIESNATNLCNLFAEIVEMVGEKNVVQMVTDIAANYKLAELDNVKSLVNLASRVTVFVYNHKWPLNWLRKRPGWKEIIRPGATQFGTVFIALQSLYDHKEDLQAMVISNEFKKMLKVGNVVECKQIVLNEIFWKNCLITVKNEVFQGVLEMVEKTFKGDDVLNIILNLGRFRDAEGTFGRFSVIASRNLTRPDEWWKLFGEDIPVLQKLKVDMRSYDPVDYENIDKIGFWVVEEEREGELNYDDLENMLDEQEHEPTSESQGDHVDDEVDSEFQLLSDREIDAYNTPISQDP
uniref:BED-type domain-containing protein n=1 Tax=Lactuca sativa TaxID=4236 RepID=A0A9R1WRG6_LACSA|nr:hypothetical protein LSAT_V11C100017740 [Lactuca sativa]